MKKKLILCFIIILFIAVITIIHYNQKPTSNLPMKATHYVNTDGPFQFAFHYEKEEPEFEFISPKGIVYKEGVTSSDKLMVERATQVSGLKSVYYIFTDGEIGEWQIFYDKFSNETVDFYYSEE